jgi:HK97 family phage portal protein
VASFITRLFSLVSKAPPANLQSAHDRGNWWYPIIREPFTGAWQRNRELSRESILTFSAVYSCVTLIASDVGKLRLRLVEQDKDGIWSEVNVPAFSPILRKPNRWQNRISFIQQWVISKLLSGNTYVLKRRDNRGVVVEMYVLDPSRCKPLVAPNAEVYYEIRKDNLSGVEDETLIVPASEIIHDMMPALFHPLCGVSPITACGHAASHGLTIQETSAALFANDSTPGGILTAPGAIDPDTALRIKETWETNFTGKNAKRIAVVGDGLKYEKMSMSASDTQLIEQLKWDQRDVCTAFQVPAYMIGVGDDPKFDNIEALNQHYYSQCLQKHLESIELCLDEGLGLTDHKEHTYGTEFDLDDLLRMDTATKVKTAVDGLKGVFTVNETRKKFDLKPQKGGDTVYMQQQQFSLEALAKRDAMADPFGVAAPAAPEKPIANDNVATDEDIAAAKAIASWKLRSLMAERV